MRAQVQVEDLRRGELRHVAELVFQPRVVQHRAVAQEVQLLRAVLRQPERLEHAQGESQQPRRQHEAALAQLGGDLVDREHAVAGDVEDAGPVAHDGLEQAADHVLVPDEDERAVRTADGDQARLLEERGDLVPHRLAEDSADAEHHLLQFGMLDAPARQHLLHQPLVVRIGKGLVAAQRTVFGEPRRVVGVVAVGRAARADDDLLHAGGGAGDEHVLRALHVHRKLEFAVALPARRDDGSEVHHGVDLEAVEQLDQPRRAHVGLHVLDAGQALFHRRLAHVRRDDAADFSALRRQGGNELRTEIAARAGYKDRMCAHDGRGSRGGWRDQ